MPFFLIGRGPDDDLRLLSTKPLESRQDAMAELSRLSADPAFEHWDAEVSVMDLDAGVPVLLVRPSEAPVAAETVPAEESTADAWEADLPPEETVEPVAAEVFVTSEAEEPGSQAGVVAVAAPVDDVAIADAITEEAGEAEEPVAAPEAIQAQEPELAPGENDELRAAILRTTQHMTAEGIVPPDSIGSAADIETDAAPNPEPETVPELPADIEAAEAPSADVASAAWPWDTAAETPEEASGVAPEVAGVFDALEEPSDELPEPDVEAVLRRPVMMGSYDEETDASATPVDESTSAAMGTLAEEAEPVAAEQPEPEAESDFILDLDTIQPVALSQAEGGADMPAEHPLAEEVAPAAGESVDAAAESAPASEAVEEAEVAETAGAPGDEAPAAVAAEAQEAEPEPTDAAAAGTVSPLEDYTCEDCVYMETCPNRDQRLPKDCGSFQWR